MDTTLSSEDQGRLIGILLNLLLWGFILWQYGHI